MNFYNFYCINIYIGVYLFKLNESKIDKSSGKKGRDRIMGYITTEQLPAFHQFAYLHEESGLKKSKKASYTKEQLYEAVCNSFYTFSIYDDHQLIAFGRMISDGIYQALICDVMVAPTYQKKGLGKQVIEGIVNKCNERGIESIQLFAVKGKQQFYKKLGFQERDSEAPGMSLVQ